MISTLHLALYNNLMEACSREPCAAFFSLLSVDGHAGISITFHSKSKPFTVPMGPRSGSTHSSCCLSSHKSRNWYCFGSHVSDQISSHLLVWILAASSSLPTSSSSNAFLMGMHQSRTVVPALHPAILHVCNAFGWVGWTPRSARFPRTDPTRRCTGVDLPHPPRHRYLPRLHRDLRPHSCVLSLNLPRLLGLTSPFFGVNSPTSARATIVGAPPRDRRLFARASATHTRASDRHGALPERSRRADDAGGAVPPRHEELRLPDGTVHLQAQERRCVERRRVSWKAWDGDERRDGPGGGRGTCQGAVRSQTLLLERTKSAWEEARVETLAWRGADANDA